MTGIEASTRQVVRQGEQIFWVALLWTVFLVGCVFLAAGTGYDDSIGVRLASTALAVGFAVVLARSLRIAFIWDADGILVRNMLRTRWFGWFQIECLELRPSRGRGMPASSVARLTDGRLVTIQALSPAIIGIPPIAARLEEINAQRPDATRSKQSGPPQ